MAANASIKCTTRCLIEWQLHTMTRPSEASGARWDEIDLDEKIWVIPAERMKKRKEHRIPLTEQALELLVVIRPISGNRVYIFPSDRDPKKPCNSQTANMALKRMGFAGRLVSHGLRSLASTTLNEQGFEADLIEAALAHVDDNQVRSAYNRTDYLERRRPMMFWYNGHIEEASKGELWIKGKLVFSQHFRYQATQYRQLLCQRSVGYISKEAYNKYLTMGENIHQTPVDIQYLLSLPYSEYNTA